MLAVWYAVGCGLCWTLINGWGSVNMATEKCCHVVDTLSEKMSGLGLEFYPFKVNCSVAVSLRPLS